MLPTRSLLVPALFASGLLAPGLAAQTAATDLIYYPFVAGTGNSVLNLYAGTNNPVPRNGTMVSTNGGGAWEANGRTGACMRGKDSTSATNYTYVDTGWKGGMTGSMTMAWFMRLRTDLGLLSNNLPNIGYFTTGIGSFRVFTGGVANRGLVIRAWGGSPADIYLGGGSPLPHTGYDLHTAAKSRWVHVALVIDASAGTGTWYVDGAAQQVTAITGSVNLPTSTGNNLRVGAHTSTGTAFNYDVDDFRLLNRAATPAEISQWAMAYLSADKTDLSMAASASQNLSLNAGSAQAFRLYWIFGSISGAAPGVTLGGVHIPLQPDPYTDLAMTLTNGSVFTNFRSVLDQNGSAKASLNLPKNWNDPSAIGTTLHHAYVVYDPLGTFYLASNPVEARIVR